MTSHIKILILNWNGKQLLKQCLASIDTIDYPNFSIMVIDNGSSDGSLDMITDNYPNVEVLSLEENYGFAGGYNRCFTQIINDESEFILLLNNDTEVNPDILNSFSRAKEQFGDNQIYGGKIYYQNNPEIIWYAGGKVNLKLIYISHRGLRKLDSNEFSIPNQTDYITGCCLFTSKEVIYQLNGFDERFNMYGEDVDLCLRAKQEGINCYYWPDAKLYHHVSASLGGEFSIKKISKKMMGMARLIKKHF